MSKVFRLNNIKGDNTLLDWQESQVYGPKTIEQIEDPDGGNAKKEITSIPSPFARIDLVKTAFREVVALANKAGDKGVSLSRDTIYHKMVSESFDVAQIFFNFDRFKDKFKILVWDKANNLDTQNALGKTLDLYLKADAIGDDPYNFSRMNRIYLLNYIGRGRPSDMNIVGGTSPATLFFSSANLMNYVSNNILFDNDRPFDVTYQPLYKRNFDFQKYLFALRKSNIDFAEDFPEVDDYLDLTYGCLTDNQKEEIDQLNETSVNNYNPIKVAEDSNDILEILGAPFHKKSKVINWSLS